MYSFGSGVLIGTRTDIPNVTPINFGILQDVTIEETASTKELTGQYQYPVAIARGTIKTTGKAKMAKISGLAFANLFYGITPVPGQIATAFAEGLPSGPYVVPSASPYSITVANAATFIEDAGVINGAFGVPLTLAASGSTLASGEYSVNDGVYTFFSGDEGKSILISYTYSVSSTAAVPVQKFTVSNPLLGITPVFKAKFFTTYQNQSVSLQLNACTSSKLSFQTKLEDFVMPEFDFSCFADASNNVMTWSFSEVS